VAWTRLASMPAMKGRHRLIAVVMVAVGGAMSVAPVLAGYVSLSASYNGNTCNGYGMTSAPPGYSYASTNATTASGVPLSACVRGIPLVEFCDAWGCYDVFAGYSTSYMYVEDPIGYSAHAQHVLAVPIDASSSYAVLDCTSSWTSGSTSCPS
jgi:hypothetical protein